MTNLGPPVDPATVGELFDPLRRGMPRGRDDDRGNLGLGLFIVQEIARAHGGEVRVHCDKGETTFAVYLPRRVG